MKAFEQPIYVTRPMLADLNDVNSKLQEIWGARWLTNGGSQHQLLEKRLKILLKVPYLSLFNNGTIALLCAIRALRLTGEVITTPFTFAATPHSLSWSGIQPVFCDIDANTMNMDPGKIESLLTPKTTAILGVHVFGIPCNVFEIQKIASKYGLKVIYDAAHAFNTEIDGLGIGSFGDVTMFSFHATKLFHTLEGGALAFNDPKLKENIELLKNFGIKNEEEVSDVGINGKMNEVQAAIGLANLACLESEREKRAKVIEAYKDNFFSLPGISFFETPRNIKNSLQYFVIRINKEKYGLSRDDVYLELKKFNVFARKYFYPLCSSFSCYKDSFSAHPSKLPEALKAASEVLAMPLYGDLKIGDVGKICEILKKIRN